MTRSIAIIGCGFVADLYMRSLETFPDINVMAVYDHNPDRLRTFCAHWSVPAVDSLDAAMAALNGTDLDGRTIRVDVAQAKQRSGGGGGGRGYGGGW